MGRVYCIYSVLLLIVINQFNIIAALGIDLREKCHELTNQSAVECKKAQDKIELVYPGPVTELSPTIRIRIKPNEHVEIRCYTNESFELDILPVMTIGSSPTLRIINCLLSSTGPVQSILERLSMNDVRSLYLEEPEFSESPLRHFFHGLPDLERLTIVRNRPTTLPEDIFSDLKNLTSLSLHLTKANLSPDTFLPLENLTYLKLNNNDLREIPPGIFRNQGQLRYIDLRENHITNLTKDTFVGAPSIKGLELAGNNIQTIHPDVFSPLKNLVDLNISFDRLQSPPAELLTENKKLTSLILNSYFDQSIAALPAGFLANLPYLKMVHISDGLNTISADTFANSTRIHTMSIVNNHFRQLPTGLFTDQGELTKLDLGENELVSLPEGIFRNLRNLRYLRLSNNELKSIPDAIFESLTNLQSLHLDGNRLITIGHHLLANNQIDEYVNRYPFERLEKLRVLNLRNNSIGSIPSDWSLSNRMLDTVDLSYNNITEFSDQGLQSLGQRMMINLTHNPISAIHFDHISYMDGEVGNQEIHIAFGHNPVICDCELMKFLKFLNGQWGQQMRNAIQVSVEDLRCIGPESPNDLRGRLVSSLSADELVCSMESPSSEYCPKECSCYVSPLDSTLIVNCSNAGLTETPTLSSLHKYDFNAIELYVENNDISQLPLVTTAGFANITRIYAANNSLNQIHSENLPQGLTHLDLSSNRLQTLDDTVLEALSDHPNLRFLSMGNNLWSCDCSSQNLLHFIRKHFKIIIDLAEIQCTSGQLFQNLVIGTDCPREQKTNSNLS